MRKRNGYSLLELGVVLAILLIIGMVAVPAFANLRRRAAMRAASSQLRSIFHLVRMRAIVRGRNAGVKFVKAGSVWQFAVYDDGDRDGVRNEDIASGVDRLVEPPRVVLAEAPIVTIGLLNEIIKDPDGDPLPPGKGPVHFNKAAICSFSPLGESTPGTIYITNGIGDLWCVRIYGATAKMRTLRYDRGKKKWVS